MSGFILQPDLTGLYRAEALAHHPRSSLTVISGVLLQ
jgi:hypothetical protein